MATGKSEKQQVIAFIDYENCSNLTEISLNIYTELIIFAGAKQNNVALPVNAFPEAVKITLRHVSEVSRNNVDFHLVLELGQCVCHYGPEKEYHIVSADKGYDGIVRTLQARGIRCRRVSPDKAVFGHVYASGQILPGNTAGRRQEYHHYSGKKRR